MPPNICYTALKNGQVNCFIHLDKLKYQWKPYSAYFVVWQEICKYQRKLIRNEQDKKTYLNHLECLKYLSSRGCRFIREEALTIARNKQWDQVLINYLLTL